MLKTLPDDTAPVIDPARLLVLLALPPVQEYLVAFEAEAPGLDLTVDYAVAMGMHVVHETRAGRLDHYRGLAALTFDLDEFDGLVSAALVYLLPMVLAGERPRDAQ